jgi:hypothetical protein
MNWYFGNYFNDLVSPFDRRLRVFAMKYQTHDSPASCMESIPTRLVTFFYNSQYGTLAATDTSHLADSSRPYALLRPDRSLTVETVLSADSATYEDLLNPPSIYWGFYLRTFQGGEPFFEDNSVEIFYLVTAATQVYFNCMPPCFGTVYQLTGTQAAGCHFADSEGWIQFFPLPAIPGRPDFIPTQGYYMGTVDANLAIQNQPGFLTASVIAGTANVTFWVFAAVGSFPADGLCGNDFPAGVYFINLANFENLGDQRNTELHNCIDTLGSKQGECNGPILMTWIPSLGAILVNPNFNPTSHVNPPPPGSPLYLTMANGPAERSPLSIGEGVNGIPTANQRGWYFTYTSNVINTTMFLTELRNLGDTSLAASSSLQTCGIFYLSKTNQETRLALVPFTGPPVQLSDCETCTNCACNDFLAERGNGSICCPAYTMGPNCTINAAACTIPSVGQLCSGNGNASYPGSIDGTGCYNNSGTFQCACLPDYIPPYCLFRYDTTCGRPLCHGHGNCSLVDPQNEVAGFTCYCEEGYRGPQCEFPIVQCFAEIDGPVCSGHGTCDDPECTDNGQCVAPDSQPFATPLCICDEGYAGTYCERPLRTSCLEISTGEICADRGLCRGVTACDLPFGAVRPVAPCTNCTLAFAAFAGYGIVSGQAVNNTGASEVVGNIAIGTGPGAVVTGFEPSGEGVLQGSVLPSASLAADVASQLAILNALECTITLGTDVSVGTGLVGTLTPGVYCFSGDPSTVYVRSAVALDGENDFLSAFVFRVPHNFIMSTASQMSLINRAQASNVFFLVTNGTVNLYPSATFMGIAIGINVTAAPDTQVTGTLVSTLGPVLLDTVLLTAANLPTRDLPCRAAPTAFDLCNISNPSVAGRRFCNNRIGLGKKLLSNDPTFDSQVFSLAVVQCLINPHTIRRGFALMNFYGSFCIIEEQATTQFFLSAGQNVNYGSCSNTLIRAGGQLQVFTFADSNPGPFAITQNCYATSLIGSAGVAALANPMREAIVTGVRVGDTNTTENNRDTLLAACQQLAILYRSPYYGVNDVFSLCWLPDVESAVASTPPSAALSGYFDFDYDVDIENPFARLFYVALTSSI